MRLSLLVLLACLLGPATYAQIERLPRPDSVRATQYGAAVAFDGDRVVVGASGETSCDVNAGAAYVYERAADDTFVLVARLVPKDCQAEQFFGRSVALDGDRVLVSAAAQFFNPLRPNTAYVFERQDDGTWEQTARLSGLIEPDEGAYAACVALGTDAEGEVWALVTAEADPTQGAEGSAYLYRLVGRGWKLDQRIAVPADRRRFGAACAFDGTTFAVSAPSDDRRKGGALYVFEQAPADADEPWVQRHRFDGLRGPRLPVALDGRRLLVGEPAADREDGRASLYLAAADGTWYRAATLQPQRGYDRGGFGTDVALSGGRALVVGYDEQLGQNTNVDRVVYSFALNPTTGDWAQRQVFDLGRYAFGAAVALVGAEALVGEAASEIVGAAYLVRLM
ncbi:MAG: hypothetical protein AAF089_06335 [Bacteroidota bacterium]